MLQKYKDIPYLFILINDTFCLKNLLIYGEGNGF